MSMSILVQDDAKSRLPGSDQTEVGHWITFVGPSAYATATGTIQENAVPPMLAPYRITPNPA